MQTKLSAVSFIGYGVLVLAACAPSVGLPASAPLTPNHSTVPPATATVTRPTQTPALVSAATPSIQTPAQNATVVMSKTPPANAKDAAQQLVQAIELALNEMRATQADGDIAEIQTHAQSSLNILVGRYGRWYNTNAPDPSNKLGVLPGETQPQGGADGDRPPPPTAGLALLTMGTSTTPSPELVAILGDVKLWQSNPRAGYDSITNAVNTADLAQLQLGKLQGSVPRAVAWQRLALTQATTLENANAYSAQTIAELETALAAAREIAK
jgi:hypothetical protein